jgi:hypothetical protein
MAKIQAIRTANSMLPGYIAPQEVKTTSRKLVVELNSIGHSDLVDLISALKESND